MDFDSFFSAPRWKILEILAKNPSSPIQISNCLNTSVAYVSQQLKLLEAAGIIVKERTGAAEKGKPRSVYSLSRELVYISLLIKNFPHKKMLYLTEHHKTILRIWLLDDPFLHYHIEKLYWKVEEDLKDIKLICFENIDNPRVIIFSDSKKVKQKIDSFLKNSDGKLKCSVLSEGEIKKVSMENMILIYDSSLFSKDKELKGGKFKSDEPTKQI